MNRLRKPTAAIRLCTWLPYSRERTITHESLHQRKREIAIKNIRAEGIIPYDRTARATRKRVIQRNAAVCTLLIQVAKTFDGGPIDSSAARVGRRAAVQARVAAVGLLAVGDVVGAERVVRRAAAEVAVVFLAKTDTIPWVFEGGRRAAMMGAMMAAVERSSFSGYKSS
jgi:hypothetical protein